jgi:hypothetical protein
VSPEELERLARLEGTIGQMEQTVRSFGPTAMQVITAEHEATEARRDVVETRGEVKNVEERLTTRIDRSHEALLREIGLVRTACGEIRTAVEARSTVSLGGRATILAALIAAGGTILLKVLFG